MKVHAEVKGFKTEYEKPKKEEEKKEDVNNG